MNNFTAMLRRCSTTLSRLNLPTSARYHGVWAPGVRLLQNLQFRYKGLLMVLVVLVPMAYLSSQVWRSAYEASAVLESAVQAMDAYADAVTVAESMVTVARAMATQESGGGGASDLREALEAEAWSYTAFEASMQRLPASGTGARAQLALLRPLRDKARALAVDQTPVDGGVAPRHRAMFAYEQQQLRLHAALLRIAATATQGDELSMAAIRGALGQLPALRDDLRRSASVGTRLYKEAERAESARRLAGYLAEFRVRYEAAQIDLEPLIVAGQVDASMARAGLAHIAAYIDKGERLVRSAPAATSEQDIVLAAGVDAAAFKAQAELAYKVLGVLHEDALLQATHRLQEMLGAAKRQANGAIGWLVAGFVAVSYLMVCMNKVVGGGLHELCHRVDLLAAGDLSEKPPARGRDEVGRALNSLGQSVRRMSALFDAVTQGVAAVSHASREVASGNAGLAGRTNDIRQSISEVSARAQGFMDAMSACSAEVERISEHMHDVRADAQRSRKAMGTLQERMAGLQQKSREIARVVSLVEAIAHQTRLLSLNASVEAARAGAAGKGFAVVAHEVRELAKRSEAAARKIYDIVSDSVAEVEHGGVLSERVGESVRNTDERIEKVSAIVADIVRLTRSGHSQSREVVDLAQGVSESVGGNARMVDQLANASGDLRTQGDNLKRSMQHFVFE